MTASASFIEFLKEQMAGLGPVTAKRMFGGCGLYRGGLIFALVIDDTLYFKADEQSRAEFAAEGLEPFRYSTKSGTKTVTSYWRAPERCLDDGGEMTRWGQSALDAAARAKPKLTKR